VKHHLEQHRDLGGDGHNDHAADERESKMSVI